MNTHEKTPEELLAISDKEIQRQIQSDSDVAPELDDVFENAALVEPEVMSWFKKRYGQRYQAYMAIALREYMENHTA